MKKNVKISIKLRVFSDRLFVSSHRGGGVGVSVGWGGWGYQWVGGGNSVVGADSGGNSEGGQQSGCLQPLRTALHTISISLQNSLS